MEWREFGSARRSRGARRLGERRVLALALRRMLFEHGLDGIATDSERARDRAARRLLAREGHHLVNELCAILPGRGHGRTPGAGAEPLEVAWPMVYASASSTGSRLSSARRTSSSGRSPSAIRGVPRRRACKRAASHRGTGNEQPEPYIGLHHRIKRFD
jgi:hypothetical protein